MRRPTSAGAASLSVPQLLRRVRDSPYFSLERPATPAQIEVGGAAWQEWFGIPMPVCTDQAMPLDLDPAVPGVEADTPGVPAGSDRPSGESDFVDGVEGPGDNADADAGALETPIVLGGAADLGADEATTED